MALFENSGSLRAINHHIHHALSLSAGSHVWVLFQKTFCSVNILRPLAQAPLVWEWSFSSLCEPGCHKWATRSHKLSVCTTRMNKCMKWGKTHASARCCLKRWIVFFRHGEEFAILKTAQSQLVELSLRLNSKQTQRSANIFLYQEFLKSGSLNGIYWKKSERVKKKRFNAKKVFVHLKFPWKCSRLE